MTLPNFFVIGAQKAGTTSLYHYLDQHPGVYMSPVKEPHFFDYEGERPRFGGPERRPSASITSMEQYRKLFEGVADERAVGEASPTYLYLPGVPERIKRYAPEAKFVAVLRNPVERAYSAYLHTVRNGREPLNDFALALREEEGRIRENWHHVYHYKARGFYYDQLVRYHEAFGAEKVRVYLYEDLNGDPVGVSRDVFRFLGVDDSFAPDISVRYNASGVPRNRAVAALVKRAGALVPALKRLVPFETRQGIKSRIFAKPPPLSEETRAELVEEYREDVLKLQDLIERDLSGWLDGTRRAR